MLSAKHGDLVAERLRRARYTVAHVARTTESAVLAFRRGVRASLVLADAGLVRQHNFRFLRAAVRKCPVVLMCDCGESENHGHPWTIPSIVFGAADITSCPIPEEEVETLWRHIATRRQQVAEQTRRAAARRPGSALGASACAEAGSGDNTGMLLEASSNGGHSGVGARLYEHAHGYDPAMRDAQQPLSAHWEGSRLSQLQTVVGMCEDGILLRSMNTGRYIVNKKLAAVEHNTLFRPRSQSLDTRASDVTLEGGGKQQAGQAQQAEQGQAQQGQAQRGQAPPPKGASQQQGQGGAESRRPARGAAASHSLSEGASICLNAPWKAALQAIGVGDAPTGAGAGAHAQAAAARETGGAPTSQQPAPGADGEEAARQARIARPRDATTTANNTSTADSPLKKSSGGATKRPFSASDEAEEYLRGGDTSRRRVEGGDGEGGGSPQRPCGERAGARRGVAAAAGARRIGGGGGGIAWKAWASPTAAAGFRRLDGTTPPPAMNEGSSPPAARPTAVAAE